MSSHNLKMTQNKRLIMWKFILEWKETNPFVLFHHILALLSNEEGPVRMAKL